jgi:ankyrin repeat protein
VLHELTEVIDARILPFEVDDDGDEGYTPFHFAALYGKPNSLQALIASYDGVNVRSIPRGDTALHIAVQKLTAHEARARTLQILASSPAVDPNIPNSTTGVTSLMLAARAPSSKDYDAELALSNDDTKLALRILCSRVDLDLEVEDLQGRTAFWHACSMQGTASAFLSHYPDVDANAPDHDGVTPFMMACRHGSLDLVLQLLNRGDINMDIQNSRGRTASFYALERDIIAKPLLSSPNINLDLRDCDGTTLFMVACESGSTDAVRELLASDGEDGPSYVHQLDNEGRTALVRCCAGTGVDQAGRHRWDIVNLLLRHGSDPHVHDHVEGRTPLMWAVSIGDLTTSKQLLAFEPSQDLSQRDNSGRSILMLAAQTGYFSLFSFLHAQMGRRADANLYNAQDIYGRTALMYACERGNREILNLLLQCPWIEVALHDRGRRTAVDWALHRDSLQQ